MRCRLISPGVEIAPCSIPMIDKVAVLVEKLVYLADSLSDERTLTPDTRLAPCLADHGEVTMLLPAKFKRSLSSLERLPRVSKAISVLG